MQSSASGRQERLRSVSRRGLRLRADARRSALPKLGSRGLDLAMTVYQTGDRVRIRYAGRQVDGQVKLASSNGRSLFLEFEALLGGYAGGMPVIEEAGRF